ncbi:MAG: hypothetical protein BM564_09180 [Bacteroidetes bacterium MedPE-SWsnd-G2]|nr:MAG: hypothetical protein BM564_09180 [Bacteroidetes bacterium MedPE-SWsnd-G2]
MCFQISQSQAIKELNKKYAAKSSKELASKIDQPNFHLNGFNHPKALIITSANNDYSISESRWGIAPENTIDIDKYYSNAHSFGGGLNSKSEVLFSHFLYKEIIYQQRCLIPVSGFIEPYKFNGKSYPYYIKHKKNLSISLAGLYTQFQNFTTFSIITKTASPFFAEIHNVKKRQPVILNRNNIKHWLNPKSNVDDIKNCINSHFDETQLDHYPINNVVYKRGIDSNTPDVLKPYFYQELQTLF